MISLGGPEQKIQAWLAYLLAQMINSLAQNRWNLEIIANRVVGMFIEVI